MRHSFSRAVAVACLLSAPLVAARTEPTSWGKPGVTIDQYRTDAITCGRAGYYLDVSNTEAAHVFKDATGQIEANESDMPSVAMLAGSGPPEARRSATMELGDIVNRSARIVEGARPAKRMKEVGDIMNSKVDDCLRSRGYIHFKLTDSQRKHLAHLHFGSVDRHLYLYQLGSDPEVLRAQAM